VDISFDHDIDTTDAIKLDFIVLVIPPVAHSSHVLAVGLVFFVAYPYH
jgi:hypothetical protein